MVQRLIQYLKDVRVEMTKVTWPSKDELLNSTTVVIVISLLFAIYIFCADGVLNRIIGLILKLK